MDDEQNQPQPEEKARIKPIGERLRRQREGMSLALEDVAKQLHLEHHILQALESDRFETLPGPAYIKGYLRAYGQLLGMESQRLIDDYQLLIHPVEPELKPGAAGTRNPMVMRGWIYAVGSTVALVLILLAAWLYAHWQKPAATSSVKSAPTHSSVLKPAGAPPFGNQSGSHGPSNPVPYKTDDAAAPLVSSTSSHQVGSGLLPAPGASHPVPLPQGESAAETSSKPLVGHATLILNLNHRSWVQIKDANGKQLLYGMVDPGAHPILTGTAPFSVFLGYAQGVQLSIDGQHINILPYIRDNHTARFQVQAPASTATKTGS